MFAGAEANSFRYSVQYFNTSHKILYSKGIFSYSDKSLWVIKNYYKTYQPQEEVKNLHKIQLISDESRVEVKAEAIEIGNFLQHIISPSIHHINSQDEEVAKAQNKFKNLLDHKKLLRDIQNAIFSNIFKSA
jgi:hypothetical protein